MRNVKPYIGRYVSRKEALRLSREALLRAEHERVRFAEEEAARTSGFSYDVQSPAMTNDAELTGPGIHAREGTNTSIEKRNEYVLVRGVGLFALKGK
jgi:hypothetical protein